MPITPDVVLGDGTRVVHPELVNMFGCEVGDNSMIGPFVEIQRGATIGQNCKIQSHSFICEGISICDNVFIGHGVVFTNDRWPRATNLDGGLKSDSDWTLERTIVEVGASIGSGATILPGLIIGRHSLVAAGAVVTKDVPEFAIVAGCPSRVVGDVRSSEPRMKG